MADIARVEGLACWRTRAQAEPLAGGMTNRNYVVRSGGERFVVRLGVDIPQHMILRWHEVAVSRAAHAADLSPEVVHAEAGALVLRFVEGETLTADGVRARLPAVAALLRRCHDRLARHMRGPVLAFWPFQIVRDYAATLAAGGSPWAARLDDLRALNARLERALVATTLVLAHNDLLAGNLIDDGRRLWLIDWDYAGLNTPLFDLANLATNNGLGPDEEATLLERYLAGAPDSGARRGHAAMRVASLLRETLWSMVSELHPAVDFDYAAYTRDNLARLEAERIRFDRSEHGR
jgi:thiamine kinase-like enzyme